MMHQPHMNLVKQYKTFYIGEANKNSVISSTETILFDDITIWAYGDLISKLADSFWKFSFLNQQNIHIAPGKLIIYVSHKHSEGIRINPANKNTSLETLEWFINNMVPPRGGLVCEILFYENLYSELEQNWSIQTIWPLKQQWVGDGNYITVNKINLNSSHSKMKRMVKSGHDELIENIENYSPYAVKYVSYIDGEEYIAETLKHSKRHFTYLGASYFMANMINIPTVCYASPMYPNINLKYEHSYYNSGSSTNPSRAHHYDSENKMCIQKPQACIRHAFDKQELFNYITFSQNLTLISDLQ
jgi:hypothetical protein